MQTFFENEKHTLGRRQFIGTSLLLLAATALKASPINHLFSDAAEGPFVQKPLGYSFDALEPYIDKLTMEIHFTKHHTGYIKNLNKAVEDTAAKNMDIYQILEKVSTFSPAIRNNAGGHFNHEFFWKQLSPEKTEASSKLNRAIEEQFKDLTNLKKQVTDSAMKVFGSGWVWLYVNNESKLAISTTPNQDNPLMDIADHKGEPILGIDVWEHAYYLKHQNKRVDYLNAIWNVIDWTEVSKRYKEALR